MQILRLLTLRPVVLTVLFLGAIFAGQLPTALAADLPYLYERLNKNSVYRSTLQNLLKGKQITQWLRAYMTDRNGVDTPGKLISVKGKPYELYMVCQPHSCPGNFIYVLYDVGGEKAVALLTIESNEFRFFGDPTGPEKEALFEATKY